MEFLKLNQKLQVILEESANVSKACVSQIIDYDNSAMLIAEPQYMAHPISIPVGSVVEVLVLDPNCIYSFNTSVIGKHNDPPSLWLNLPESYRRVQRREYVRVNIKLPLVLTLKDDTQIMESSLKTNILAEEVYKDGYFNSITIDVSGGGVKLFTPIQFEMNSLIDVMLRLPMKEVTCTTRVVRSELNSKITEKDFLPKDFAKFNYITALCFMNIEDTDRSTIIQLCFKRQLELRQRGII